MSKKTHLVRDARKKVIPESSTWEPMHEIPVPDGNWPPDEIPVRAYMNNIYQVWVYECPSSTDPTRPPLTHLSIKRHDRGAAKDWRHFQRIKNEICGKECEGVEIYPAESRLCDTSNQYHLWVLPVGMGIPFGYTGRCVTNEGIDGAVQRPFEPGCVPEDAMSQDQIREALKKLNSSGE